jgi:pimeloyl-ACP methyl ester carboxylesterase
MYDCATLFHSVLSRRGIFWRDSQGLSNLGVDSQGRGFVTSRCLRKVILFLLSLVAFTSASCGTTVTETSRVKLEPKIHLTPCRFPKYSEEVLCGKVDVFEDRAAQSGRRITLNIVVLSALAAKPKRDPVFFLYGGPGVGAAVSASRGGDDYWRELRHERDLVFIDQRGTGESHRLNCNLYDDKTEVQVYYNDMFPVDKIRACRKQLQKIADLKLYTTPIAMDDIDEVREAMGYEKINLYGASYGTLSALEYLRRHSTRVRSAVLAGVATPAMKFPLQFSRGAQDTMEQLMEDCATDETCRVAFPNLRADFAAVLDQFEKGSVSFEIPHPKRKQWQLVRMSRGIFVEKLRLMLYSSSASTLVPLLIHRAAQGDWVPFGRAALPVVAAAIDSVSGMYLTVTCSEGVAAITEEEIVRETSNTFLGDYRTRTHLRACQEWPRGDISADFYQPVKSNVPLLMLSSEFDPATPPQFGRDAASFLPNSRQIVIRNIAHGYGSDCLRSITAEFISKGSAEQLDTACIASLRPPAFVIELPAELK